MGNWASRPGVEGGWETYWDESAPAATPITPDANPAINYRTTGPAPSNYRASSLGDYAINEYLRGLEFEDQLGNRAMRSSPYLQSALNPGGAGLSDEDKRALYYGMMSANDPTLAGIINNITSGQNTGAYLPEGFDYNSNIYLAPRVDDDGDFGDIMKFMAIAGGLSGIGNLFAGNLGGVAGAGLDAFTAADMAAGDAMLAGMGQDYGSFLNSLNTTSTAALPNITDVPTNFATGTTDTAGGVPDLDTVIDFGVQQPPAPVTTGTPTTVNPNVSSTPNLGNIVAGVTGSGALGNAVGAFTGSSGTGAGSGSYQFPWANVIGGILEAYGQNNYRNDLQALMERALNESDPFKAQRPRYFEPLYQAATQGVGGTPYGEAIANSTLRKLSSTGDAGYDITGLGANTLAKNLNSASLDYVKALTPLTGASFQANTGAASTLGQGAAQAGLGTGGALGSVFSSAMTGQQPSSIERIFGGKQANQTLPQYLASI